GICSIASRIPGLLSCYLVLIFGVSLIGGVMGREGPLNVLTFSVQTNTMIGVIISLLGLTTTVFLSWLFMIQIPYLC
ncbi:Unannotated, partial [Lentimonas sp. CC19]